VSEDRSEIDRAFTDCRSFVCEGLAADMFSAEVVARDALCSLDVSASLAKLAEACAASDIESIRAEYLRRFINVVTSGCKVGKLGTDIPTSEEDFGIRIGKSSEVQAFSQFLQGTARDNWKALEGPSFPAQIQDGQNALTWANQVLKEAGVQYARTLDAFSDKLEKMKPSAEEVSNPAMLTDRATQKLLFGNPNRQDLNPQTQVASDMLVKLKRAKEKGYAVRKELKEAFKRLTSVRGETKTAIMVDWVLDHILRDKKGTAEALKAQGEQMQQMIVRTNAEMPKYMTDLLKTMTGTNSPGPAQ
ncbi:unnamed protein product, partial [Prorocentrum cordatum]